MDGKKRKLSVKHKRFCEEYLVDLNATQAAIRAGYKEKTARSQGQRLLTNVDIQKYIAELQKKQSERTGITADTVGKHLGMFSGQTEDSAAAENNLLDILKEGAADAVEPTE